MHGTTPPPHDAHAGPTQEVTVAVAASRQVRWAAMAPAACAAGMWVVLEYFPKVNSVGTRLGQHWYAAAHVPGAGRKGQAGGVPMAWRSASWIGSVFEHVWWVEPGQCGSVRGEGMRGR